MISIQLTESQAETLYNLANSVVEEFGDSLESNEVEVVNTLIDQLSEKIEFEE